MSTRRSTQEHLDPTYFNDGTWPERSAEWVQLNRGNHFVAANVDDFRGRIGKAEGGARVVINIDASALLRILRGERYKNVYLRAKENAAPEIGAVAKGIEPKRLAVDAAFGLDPPAEFFFAALSLEGTGVRYYGEYCMVLRRDLVEDDTQIVDRDSYEVLSAPLTSFDRQKTVNMLRGTWKADLADVAIMKMRNALKRDERITTTVVHAQALLEGEEFIEIHLRIPPRSGPGFGHDAIDEVRQDARDVAAGERIAGVFRRRQSFRYDEWAFAVRRMGVERRLSDLGIRTRISREEKKS